jgi:hypothetical protein
LVLNRLGIAAITFTALLAFCPLSPTPAFAQSSDAASRHHRGGPLEAPELDATSAAQGLVLIAGALVLTRRYRKQ